MSRLCNRRNVLRLHRKRADGHFTIHRTNRIACRALPFDIRLVGFALAHCPNSSDPSTCRDRLLMRLSKRIVSRQICVGGILSIGNCHFFRTSCSRSRRNAILSIGHSITKHAVACAKCTILLLNLMLYFMSEHSHFVLLDQQLGRLHYSFFLVLLALSSLAIRTNRASVRTERTILGSIVSDKRTTHFNTLPLRSKEKHMLPIGAFSSRMLEGLRGSSSFCSLGSSRFLLDILAVPRH